MKPILDIRSVSKKYAVCPQRPRYRTLRASLASCFSAGAGMREFKALDNVSLAIMPEQKWGIVGANGAGKTTLLKLIARITPPNEGRILVRGRVASLLEVGTGFHPELSGRENIFLNGAILGLSRRDIRKKFDAIVDFSEIETFLDAPVKHYSTGMWARLAFSIAAHLTADILLIDEVLSVGDAQFQNKSLGKMNAVSREGRTILFVSHNMAAVKQLCTHCLWLDKGRIRAVGAPDEVLGAYHAANRGDADGRAAAFPSRAGSQIIRVRRVELRNQRDETTGTYAIGDDLNIHLFLESAAALKKAKIIVGISEAGGAGVCNMYDSDSGFALQDVAGRRHVSLRLADLRFYPGQYHVTVKLMSEIFNYRSDAYDVLESCITFTMVNHTAIGRALKRHAGLLYLTPEWRLHPPADAN